VRAALCHIPAPPETPRSPAAGLVLMLSVVGLLHLRHAGPEGGMFPKIAAKGDAMAS
jgi:hypothetical protein